MPHNSWTHKLARITMRPLVGTRVRPNDITTARLASGLAACACFALGDAGANLWGGALWFVSAFLDRADGELARLAQLQSARGHAYDYACDVIINGLFFLAIGCGLREQGLGNWSIALGGLGGVSVVLASLWSEALEKATADGTKAYEGAGGFDFDDIMYLFTPIAWLDWLWPLLLGASIGAPIFAIVTWWRLRAAAGVRSA